jgi:hypothetical protein
VHFVQIEKDGGEKKHSFQGRQGRKIHFVRFVGSKISRKKSLSLEKKDLQRIDLNKKV